MATASEPKVDARTGTPTTGHEWDGIAELNTPLPRWWLWTFYACIIWSIGYWVVYPTWPGITGFTEGLFNWNSRSAVVEDLNELQTIRAPGAAKLAAANIGDIEKNPELLTIATATGKAAFANNCAPCHGSGAQGAKGYPNLNDDDWLWGGTLPEIYQTVNHGIRFEGDKQTHMSQMPNFGKDGILQPDQIQDVVSYVRSLSGAEKTGASTQRGAAIFAANCAACHGADAKGMKSFGSPNLTDKIWLYGGSRDEVTASVSQAHYGVMPAWGQRLDPVTVKMLAAYVHSLGGGQAFAPAPPAPAAAAAVNEAR